MKLVDFDVSDSINALQIEDNVLAHSDGVLVDWTELHNTTVGVIPVGSWFLSDTQDIPKKYRIASGTYDSAE